MFRYALHSLLILCAGLAVSLPLKAEQEASPVPDYNKTIRVTELLRTTTTTTGQPVQYLKTDKPEIAMLMVEIPPGAETGWHQHPSPCYAYILSGSITVEVEGGKSYSFHAGQAFAETVNTPHNGKNTGTEPVKILMTVAGEQGVPVAERLKKQ